MYLSLCLRIVYIWDKCNGNTQAIHDVDDDYDNNDDNNDTVCVYPYVA